MIEVSAEFKNAVLSALTDVRTNYTGTDTGFAKKYGINPSVYNQIKKGIIEKKLSAPKWLELGRKLKVSLSKRKWNMARTDVFNKIEGHVMFCKEFSKSRMLVDECAIGKTYSALYLERNIENCFYVDGSQCKTKNEFLRALAKSVGAEWQDSLFNVRESIKYILTELPKPVIIVDEAGDLEHGAFLALKEIWNATDGFCGWYLMGADGLRTKINRGKNKTKKEGYKELFSRFSSKYSSIIPTNRLDKVDYYKKLITTVLAANVSDDKIINKIVKQCLASDEEAGEETGLRWAEGLLILALNGIIEN